jgi:ferritin
MMSQTVQDAINDQIRKEFASAYVYLAMCAYLEREGFPGFAQWMRMQAKEEEAHAMRLFDHMHDRGAKVVLQTIDQPPLDWDSPLDVFESALEHERKVTASINEWKRRRVPATSSTS